MTRSTFDAMNKLPVQDYLTDITTYDAETIKGTLKCRCGCEKFYILHNGKITRGILASLIVEKSKRIDVYAECYECSARYELHRTDRQMPATDNLEKYEHKRLSNDLWSVHVVYEYPEDTGLIDGVWNCGYTEMCVDVACDVSSKKLRLYEYP